MPTAKRALYLLPLILSLFLVASELVERSMYTDGLAYAGISKNLARGVGTFWTPRLSDIHNTAFNSHPPLVFGIQSLFFEVLGEGIATERIYALTIFLLSALLIVMLWREVLRDRPAARRCWFVPLTLWLVNEVVYHFYPANVLEPTMTLFTLAAVWAGLRGVHAGGVGEQFSWAVLVGLLVMLATLCKGFVGLFPLSFFGLYWLIYRRYTFSRAILLTLAMLVTVVLCYTVLWQFPAARTALTNYLDVQVLASIGGELTEEPHLRSSRFYIIGRTFEILLPTVLLTLLGLYFSYRKLGKAVGAGTQVRGAYLFLSLGVAASFPLAISPKQSFYYLLPSMAYYALGFAMFLAPAAAHLMAISWSARTHRWVTGVAGVLLILSLVNTARHWGQVTRRDRVVLGDVEAMNTVLPKGTTIGSQGDIGEIVSYMYRTNEVSIDTAVGRRLDYDFLVARKTAVVEGLDTVAVGATERYRLYRVTSRR